MKFNYRLYALVHEQTGCVFFRVVRGISEGSRSIFFSPLLNTLKDNLRRGEPLLIEAVREIVNSTNFNTSQGWQEEWHVVLIGTFLDGGDAFDSLRKNSEKFARGGFRVLNVLGVREDLYATVYQPSPPPEAWIWFSLNFLFKENS